MKNIFLGMLWTITSVIAFAQQKPHYTQYILNQYILNPAISGIENYTDVKLSHRHQWVGIQDAPVTTYLTIHKPIGKKDFGITPTSYDMPGENPRGKAYWESYEAPPPHHGVGLQVINDKTGPLNRFSAYVTYAYHMGISLGTSLAAGIGVGVQDISLNTAKLVFDIPVDPAVYGSGVINKLKPDVNAGLYLYSATYFVGLSALQIVPQKVIFSNDTITRSSGKNVPHIFASGGYRFLVGDDFNLIPSVMVKYINPLPMQLEFNAKLQYQDKAWIGASFRSNDGFAGMVGMTISNTFNIGYSYDYTTSRLNSYSKGTHEIIIGFLLGNKYGDTCPRNVW